MAGPTLRGVLFGRRGLQTIAATLGAAKRMRDRRGGHADVAPSPSALSTPTPRGRTTSANHGRPLGSAARTTRMHKRMNLHLGMQRKEGLNWPQRA
jgi:hypothetical protein